jgi:hypothetical protein
MGGIMKHSVAAIFALAAGFVSAGVAIAAPVVPPSALPGRERDRFMESPVEHFMQPGQSAPPSLLQSPAKPHCRPGPAGKRRRSSKRC